MYYKIIVQNYHGKNFTQMALSLAPISEMVGKISLDYVHAQIIQDVMANTTYEFLLKNSTQPTIVEIVQVGHKPFQ